MPTLTMVAVDLIDGHPDNVRRDATPDPELIASVKEQGILQPIGLIQVGKFPHRYQLIAGHRRLNAAKKAGLVEVPAIILEHLDTRAKQIEAMLVENGRRQDLTPVEEAAAYQQLSLEGVSVQEISKATGRTQKTVKARLALTALPEKAAAALHGRQISLADAEIVLAAAAFPDLAAELEKELSKNDINVGYFQRRIETAKEHAATRANYEAFGLPEVKKPKKGWGYWNDAMAVVYTKREADAWWPGDTRGDYDSAPKLIRTKAKTSKKTKAELAQQAKWEKERAEERARAEREQVAKQLRTEHVVSLVDDLVKITGPLQAHLHLAAARAIASQTASEIEEIIAATGLDLKRIPNDYHQDKLATAVLELPWKDAAKVLAASLAVQSRDHLYLGYGREKQPGTVANAKQYWATFDQSGYVPTPEDKAARDELNDTAIAGQEGDAA